VMLIFYSVIQFQHKIIVNQIKNQNNLMIS